MKNRQAIYKAYIDEDRSKTIKIRADDEKTELSCLKKKYFDKDKDEVVGYIHRKNREYTGREYATLTGVTEKDIDVYSSKKIWQRVIGYMQTEDGEYLGVTQNCLVLLLLFLVLLIGGIAAGCVLAFGRGGRGNEQEAEPEIIPAGPVQQVTEETEPQDDGYRMTADVILPEGSVTFGGIVYDPADEIKYLGDETYTGTAYTGSAQTQITMDTEDGAHVLLYTWTEDIADGAMAGTALDYTMLDFEVLPGIYTGSMDITYDDGTQMDVPMLITVRSSTSGSMGISYADQAAVDMASGAITLQYGLSNSPDDTYVEVIVQNDGQEYVIARSGAISSGQTLTELPLLDEMSGRLEAGSYNGVIRVYVIPVGTEDEAVADIHTDIEVTITVR